jgi:hypothetical protein
MTRANAVAYRPTEVDVRTRKENENRPSLMTPARRAGLDALERELNEFLTAPAGQVSAD